MVHNVINTREKSPVFRLELFAVDFSRFHQDASRGFWHIGCPRFADP